MDKKLIFNENGDRGTQSMIGGNTTNLREWNRNQVRLGKPNVPYDAQQLLDSGRNFLERKTLNNSHT